MSSLQTHNNSGRKKLVITKVLEKRKVKGQKGEFDVLDFTAKVEGEDASIKYSVSSPKLFDLIKNEAIIECDVEVATPMKDGSPMLDGDGNPYHNRKIIQIYQDGEPVKSQQKQWGKSPETVMMELDSKARNTALMQACAVWLSDKVKYVALTTTETLASDILWCADVFYDWLKDGKSPPNPKRQAPEKPVGKESVRPAQQEANSGTTVSSSPIVTEIQGLLDAVNWKPATWRSWIKMQRWDGVDTTGTLAEVLSKCNPNQINMFANHLKTLKN